MRGAVREQARAVVRVLDPAGEVVGAGFLIGPDLVATCAHVVADAAGLDPYTGPRPAAPLHVDLPLVRDADDAPIRLRATVLRWSPVRANGTGDIAVLQLERAVPSGARMPPLRRVDALWDHRFRVLGFPEGQRDGVWSTGHIRGEQGTRWFQLQSDPGDQAIAPGFSGSPVWDEASGAVVGMTVAADRSADTTTAYLIPIDQVLGLDPELLPCPYRGLEPFGEEHAAFFFGRDADIVRLADALARRPMVAVAGPSGVGKSSLVRAGLVPLLRETGVRIVELRPEMSLDAALAAARQPVPVPAPAAGGGAVAMAEPGLVVLVDQFEELAATDPAAARALLLQLDAATQRNGVRAVLTLRWESLAELTNPPTDDPGARGSALDAGSALVAGTVIVGPMDRAQLRDAVVGPAERAPGLLFEDGLVDTILDDAGSEPGQLPLVESLLTELWERRVGGALTVQAYRQAGGVAGAVAKRAEELVADFPDHADLRRLFTQLTRTDRAGRFVRRPAPLAELAPELRALVPRLVAGRLLVLQRSAGGADTVELAHQALIGHWPRLRDWLIEDRDFLAWRAQLEQQRERWASTGQDDGALLRGNALVAAQQWLPARAADVAAPDQDYVQRSQARQRREVRRWRVVTAVLAVLVLVAGGLAAVALDRGNSLDQRLRAANADSLGREALVQSAADPDLANRLALAAWESDPSNRQARTALAAQYRSTWSVKQVYPAVTDRPMLDGFSLSDDGDIFSTLSDAHRFAFLTGLSSSDPRPWAIPDLPNDAITRLSRDGKQVAVASADRPVQFWDLGTRAVTGSGPTLPAASLTSLNWSPDGTRLAWFAAPDAAGRQLVMWDIATRQTLPHALPPIPDFGPFRVELTADNAAIVLGLGTRTGNAMLPARQVVRSLADGAELRTLPENSYLLRSGNVVTCQPPPDPRALGSLAVAVVIAPGSGAEVLRVQLDTGRCSDAQVSTDGNHLLERRLQISGGDAVELRVIDLTSGAVFATTVPRPAGEQRTNSPIDRAATLGVVRTPDGGRDLLSASGGSLLRLATVPEPQWVAGTPSGQTISEDGRTLWAIDSVGYATYDPKTGKNIARLAGADLPHVGKSSSTLIGNVLVILVGTRAGWFVDRFSLPDLRPISSYQLPGQGGYAVVQAAGDRVYAIASQQLTVWDTGRNEKISGPFPVEAYESEKPTVGMPNSVGLQPRPGHPDEVLFTRKGTQEVEIWDAIAGRRIGVLHKEDATASLVYNFALTPDGRRIAEVDSTKRVRIWDLDTRTLVGAPFTIPYLALGIGFDPDGHFIVGHTTEIGALQITMWDVAKGQETGTMTFGGADPNEVTADGRTINLNGLGTVPPLNLATTAQQWRDRLCTIADRPFTGAEINTLPAGFDPSSPCTRR